MTRSDLLSQIALGEDSTRQFKVDVRNAASLASEMAAFANSNGGTIFIGVGDDGTTPGPCYGGCFPHQPTHQQCRESIGA